MEIELSVLVAESSRRRPGPTPVVDTGLRRYDELIEFTRQIVRVLRASVVAMASAADAR